MYKGSPIRLLADFQARREWYDLLEMMKGEKNNNQEYPASLSFRIEGQFPRKAKAKPALKKEKVKGTFSGKGQN